MHGDGGDPSLRCLSDSLPLGVRGNFKAVSTKLHAAPPSSSFLARVEKMKNTLSTLANPSAITLGEQLRCAVGQRRKQIFGLTRLKGKVHPWAASGFDQVCQHEMSGE